jgi:hypothetical protein
MTDKNNIEKKVGSSMVDSLMPGKQKQAEDDRKAAEAARQRSWGGGYASGGGYSQSTFWDDSPDPLDDGYNVDPMPRYQSPRRVVTSNTAPPSVMENLRYWRNQRDDRIYNGEIVLDEDEIYQAAWMMAEEVARMFDAAGFVAPHPVGFQKEIAKQFMGDILGCQFQHYTTRECAYISLESFDTETGEVQDSPQGDIPLIDEDGEPNF